MNYLNDEAAVEKYSGTRVRALWNPRAGIWYVYGFDDDKNPLFSCFSLELHTVGVYGELKPKWAPSGTASFVGTICASRLVDKDTATEIKAHPYAPGVLFAEKPDGRWEPFQHCRRLYVDRHRMYADRRLLPQK